MLKIIKIKPYLVGMSLKKLAPEYIKSLENKENFDASIVARYLIFHKNHFLPLLDSAGKPIFENNKFWSISHKKDMIFVWVAHSPLWVDIETVQPRSEDVFSLHTKEEYQYFWEKNMLNFYNLWTIKESVIKLNLAGIDDLEKVKIKSLEKKEIFIERLKFDFEIYWSFKEKSFISYNWRKNEQIYSVSYFI